MQDQREPQLTRADTLRGMLTPLRTCYDITYYHLDVRIDPAAQFLKGSNTIFFTAADDFDRLQVDLFSNMKIERIVLDRDMAATFTRELNAVFVKLPEQVPKGSRHSLRIEYSGNPIVARRPPWDGGFTWERDKAGNPWVVVTCQGTGASLWWPNKDHQADEPDSMLVSITVPPGLEDISNGRLRARTVLPDGWTRFDWFVSYPINNYNVTVNIGKYAHFREFYVSGDTLILDYYVMPENLEKAKVTFRQVKPMMECYERFFGKYPFSKDGYKLVECPHTGMEHQSAVAYGNRYLGGYRGRTWSEAGLKFDFIILHESAHEWWGNSVTSKDIADMWIHESFGAYAEALFVECQYGREESLKYINGKKPNVLNDRPIIGVYDVHKRGSGDMYDKGQLVLNTLRSAIDDDPLWFSILRGLAETFKYQTITAEDIFTYINRRTGRDLNYFFDQYLKNTQIPQLVVETSKKGDRVQARFRWQADVKHFRMPIKVTTAPSTYEFINPTTDWQTIELHGLKPEDFRIAEDLFLVNLRLRWSYLDPALPD
ncbi:MAG: M1 family metallopeptidase [Ignavibacteria bacterium]|nr:M1 family metallopeptidase [Ignavibacteria bacterium]